MVSKVAAEDPDVDYYYVDVDQSLELADRFEVRAIPTLILIKNGKEANRSIGFIPENQVKKFAHS